LKTLGLYLTPCQKSKSFPEVPNFHELHPSYTGSSFTLLSVKLWKILKNPEEELNVWKEGPLYLADGEAN
jgi:hypothetical protein